MLLFLIGCGIAGLPIDSYEESPPDENTIIRRHFHHKRIAQLMIASQNREGNVLTYLVVGKGNAFPPIRYQIIYKLENRSWKYVGKRNMGYM